MVLDIGEYRNGKHPNGGILFKMIRYVPGRPWPFNGVVVKGGEGMFLAGGVVRMLSLTLPSHEGMR